MPTTTDCDPSCFVMAAVVTYLFSAAPRARTSSARPASALVGTSRRPARSTSDRVPARPDRYGRMPRGHRAAESAGSRSPAGCVEHHRIALAPPHRSPTCSHFTHSSPNTSTAIAAATTTPAKRTAAAKVRFACSPCEPDDMVGVFIVGCFVFALDRCPRSGSLLCSRGGLNSTAAQSVYLRSRYCLLPSVTPTPAWRRMSSWLSWGTRKSTPRWATTTLGNCIRWARFRRSPAERGAAMVARRLSDTPIDLRCLHCSPVGCMILALKGGVDAGWEADVVTGGSGGCGASGAGLRGGAAAPGRRHGGGDAARLAGAADGARAAGGHDRAAGAAGAPVRRVHQRVPVALAARRMWTSGRSR